MRVCVCVCVCVALQDHYDYGMRAVMAVLRAAGNLKRKLPDETEVGCVSTHLLRRTFRDAHISDAIVCWP